MSADAFRFAVIAIILSAASLWLVAAIVGGLIARREIRRISRRIDETRARIDRGVRRPRDGWDR